jgi:hypothetical protein
MVNTCPAVGTLSPPLYPAAPKARRSFIHLPQTRVFDLNHVNLAMRRGGSRSTSPSCPTYCERLEARTALRSIDDGLWERTLNLTQVKNLTANRNLTMSALGCRLNRSTQHWR